MYDRSRLPAWVQDEPIRYRGDEFYFQAFWELSSCRQFGDLLGPIPWLAIAAYADRKHLDSTTSEMFESIMRSLDEEYIKWQQEARGAKTVK